MAYGPREEYEEARRAIARLKRVVSSLVGAMIVGFILVSLGVASTEPQRTMFVIAGLSLSLGIVIFGVKGPLRL